MAGLLMMGGGGTAPILKVTVAWLEPMTLEAVITVAKIPAFVGRPKITPETGSMVRPGGRFVAANAVGALVAALA